MYNYILLYRHHVTTNMQVDIYIANLKGNIMGIINDGIIFINNKYMR